MSAATRQQSVAEMKTSEPFLREKLTVMVRARARGIAL